MAKIEFMQIYLEHLLHLLNTPLPPPPRSALHSMLSYIQRAKEKLGALSSSSSREAEAVWFMKTAWNLALQCGEHYHEMSQLFTACHQVCKEAPTP